MIDEGQLLQAVTIGELSSDRQTHEKIAKLKPIEGLESVLLR